MTTTIQPNEESFDKDSRFLTFVINPNFGFSSDEEPWRSLLRHTETIRLRLSNFGRGITMAGKYLCVRENCGEVHNAAEPMQSI